MKIATLNLAGYRNWSEREASIVSFLDNNDIDVICFQEVKFDQSVSFLGQAQLVNSKLHTPYRFSQSSISRTFTTDSKASKEGLAVLSKYPIINSETLVLNKYDDDKHTRIVQNVNVEIGGVIQKFTNVHFSNNEHSDEQLNELLSILKGRNEQRIILGDFNMYDLESVKHLYANDYTDSAVNGEYVSFPSESVRLDYALIPNVFTFNNFSVYDGLSDHTALVFEI